MAKERPPARRIPPDTPLEECERQQIGVSVPVPLSARLDELVDVLYEQGGGRTSRRELLSALLLAAPEDPKRIEECLAAYRRAAAADAAVEGRAADAVLKVRRTAPGPRARGSKPHR